MRVVLIDTLDPVRQALAFLLRHEPGIEVVGEGCTGEEAVALTHRLQPDVVMLQARLPGRSGIDAARTIHAEWPSVCLLGMILFERPADAQALRDAGAIAVVCKTDPPEMILAALRQCVAARSE